MTSTRPHGPAYRSVVDLGLRGVGAANDPRRLARQVGKAALAGFALLFVFLIALCAFLAVTGVGGWVVYPLLLALIAATILLLLRAVRGATPLVVKVRADGTNQATWLVVVPYVSLAASRPFCGSRG